MTRSGLFSNLSFEYELAGAAPSARLKALESRWNYILRLLPGWLEGEPLEGQEAGEFSKLAVWGVSPRSERVITAAGLRERFPSLPAVRRVNDKLFSHLLERAHGIALPHSRTVSSEGELKEAVASCPHDWVLKHPLGVGGRERVTGRRRQLTQQATSWASTQFKSGWTLLFEPWVEEKQELSLHFQIDPDGGIEPIGHCRILTDASGAFRGNALVRGAVIPEGYSTAALRAVEAIRDEGYWGPVGIDAFSGRLGGVPVDRPLMEINARYSFGRLTLALASWLPEALDLVWIHPKRRDYPLLGARAGPYEAADRPGLFRLPDAVDPGGLSRSFLFLGRGARDYAEVIKMVSEGVDTEMKMASDGV